MSLDLKRRYPLLVAGLVPTVLLSVAGRIIGLGRRLLFGFRKQRIPTLFTIGFSHYCDKVRWALELISGYDFEERPYLPLVHIPMVLAHTGGKNTMTPTLVTQDGRPHTNSTDILHYLQQSHPETASFLYPPAQQKDIEEFEKLCDDKLGPNARILAYGHIFSSRVSLSCCSSSAHVPSSPPPNTHRKARSSSRSIHGVTVHFAWSCPENVPLLLSSGTPSLNVRTEHQRVARCRGIRQSRRSVC